MWRNGKPALPEELSHAWREWTERAHAHLAEAKRLQGYLAGDRVSE
jgi:hypothetical protein